MLLLEAFLGIPLNLVDLLSDESLLGRLNICEQVSLRAYANRARFLVARLVAKLILECVRGELHALIALASHVRHVQVRHGFRLDARHDSRVSPLPVVDHQLILAASALRVRLRVVMMV